MPGRLFLSPLSSAGGTLRRPQPGRWFAANDFLGQYSTDILVEGTLGHKQIVRGVPSVFAQPIYFSQALGSRNHPAFSAAQGQWRGLLACFALQQWLRLPLELKPFHISEPPNKHSGRPDDVLLTVIFAQLPEPTTDWRDWWLIRCEGSLLGATSPWSLVYPSAQCQAPASIPWQRNGVLIDPIDQYDERKQGRSSTELSLLAAWVERIAALQPSRWGAPAGENWNQGLSLVTDALSQWRADLSKYLRESERDLELSEPYLGIAAPYKYFMRPIESQHVAADPGLVLHAPDGVVYIVLKRRGLDGKLRVQGATLVEELDLGAMPAESPRAWKTRTGREMKLPYVFAEDVFLTPKLTEIPISSFGLSLWSGKVSFALPLRSDIFRFFTYDDIRKKKLKVELREIEGAFAVRLSFPLVDGSVFAVERTYDKGQDVLKFPAFAAPGLAIWPDFVHPEWRHSLAIFVTPQTTSLEVVPLTISGKALEVSPSDRAGRDWVAWQSKEPLLGFALFSPHGEEREEGGLLLRAQAKMPPKGDQDAKWKVGVDFGTSNTQPMIATSEKPTPHRLDLQSRTILLSQPDDASKIEANDAFFPTDDALHSPFPTVLLWNQGWLATALAGSIPGDLFSPRFSPKPGATIAGVVRNLKWSRESGSRGDLPIRSYLTLLAQAILAEAVASGVTSVTFHWSYPLSLPEPPRQTMRNFWQTLPKAFTNSGLSVAIAEEGGRSESEAMSRYFASLPGNLPIRSEALSIAIDVGGGSADVGFWSSGQFLDQVSFKLAGNDLLVPLARDVPRFLEALYEVCQESQPNPGEMQNMRAQPEVNINALLSNGFEKVPQALHGRLPAGEAPWSIVRSVIFLYFGGVVFYLGLHARRLLDRVQRHEFALLFGGKAAGLLPWLTNDRETIERILGKLFLAGLGYDDLSRQRLPVTFYGPGMRNVNNALPPKAEVAYGLLLNPLPGEKPSAMTTTLVGELGWRSTGKAPEALPWDLEVDLATLGTLHAPDNLETGFATYFASTLVPRYAEELGLDVARLQELRLTVSDVEDTIRTLAATQGVLQPIFAGELKRLIERYLEEVKGL